MSSPRVLLLSAVLALIPVISSARNVDLSTVPDREQVELTIYNSEDLTLVRESRIVSFKAGLNQLQFSWANTRIDPTSVELRFATQPDELTLLDTAYPHDKPQMLYWNVESDIDGEVTIEISYFTSGITWSADYVVVADRGEREARMEGFVRVSNASGEDYPDARVRVVVGTINLVEKIAALAAIPMDRVGDLKRERLAQLRNGAARKAMAAGVASNAPMEEKSIIKEGLSEYFIYTIEGTETIPDGWSKRLRSFAAHGAPFEVTYRYRPEQYGDRLVRFYLMRNDEASHLGASPLPNGRVSVFRDNGRDGLSFLAVEDMDYVPVGDRVELNLGVDPRVGFELRKLQASRDNVWLRLSKGKTYRRVGDGSLALDRKGKVVGWDEHVIFARRVRNFSDRPIAIEARRHFDGDAAFISGLDARRHDFRTVQYEVSVPAGATRELLYEVITHTGRNARQQNVKVIKRSVSRPSY